MASLLSIVIPFLNIPVYFTTSEEPRSAILQTLVMISSNTSQPPLAGVVHSGTPAFSVETSLKILYVVIALLLVVRLLIGLNHILKLLSRYVVEKIGYIYFVNTQEPGTPFSFFHWLFWNRKIDLQCESGEQIFRHELFHIQQRHSYDIVFVEVLSAIFWINPFFFLIKRELKAIHEFLADEFATKGNDKWTYAELLLTQLLGSNTNHLVNSFFQSQIKRRIVMITSLENSNSQYWRKVMVLPITAFVVALFAFNFKEIKNAGTARAKFKLVAEPPAFHDFALNRDTTKPLEGVLFVVNGKIRSDIKSSADLDKVMKPEDIASISILTGDTAVAKYGQRGKNGAIEIHLKKAAMNAPTNDTIPKPHTNAVLINTPVSTARNDSEFRKRWHQNIAEIKAIAWREGKAAYEYKGRTYVFGKIRNADSTMAAFTEQNGINHVFLLNGCLVKSVEELNTLIVRNDVNRFGVIDEAEAMQRFNRKEPIVFIESATSHLVTKN